MANTGGLLNILNEEKKISSAYNSVPIIKLIRKHKPQTKSELKELIEFHYIHKCECGIRSKGTIEDFGRNLYESQLEYWGEYKFSLNECIQWEYDLFITNSLKGEYMEGKAVEELKKILPSIFTVNEVSNVVDINFRVDVEVRWCDFLVFGVQVKPESYEFMSDDIKNINYALNSKYPVEVRYLYYNSDGVFLNIDDVVKGYL